MERNKRNHVISLTQPRNSSFNLLYSFRLPCMESRMLYATHLHNYRKAMSDIIQEAELAAEFNLVPLKTEPDVVKPEKPKIKNLVDEKPISFYEKKQRYTICELI